MIHPWFLLLLVVVPLLLLAMRGSLAGMTRLQRRICFGMRATILSLLVLALCGIRIAGSADRLTVLYLVDASASVSKRAGDQAREYIHRSLAGRQGRDEAGVIGFAKTAQIWERPSRDPRLPGEWPRLDARNATEIGEAIDFARAIFPGEDAKRLVVLSDGNDTGGEALRAVRSAVAAGIDVVIVPLENGHDPEVAVEGVEAPRRMIGGEPFDLTARIRSNTATTASVRLYENGFQAGEQRLTLGAGASSAAIFRNLKAGGKMTTYEVRVVPGADTLIENNVGRALVSGSDARPRVLIVDPEPDRLRPLAGALEAANIDAEVRAPNGLPGAISDLQQFDLFVLSDVSALSMTRDQMELYRTWVRDFGGGFVMTGGENSFGVGGYFRTTLEQMLPVRMEHEDRQDVPSVALLIVLDRSGSMAAKAAGGLAKISLAAQGAVYAMNVLQARDLFGVTAVDTRVHTIQPLSRLDSKQTAEAKILAITASGGGIYVYTSLVDAAQALREANARIKHIILFSDAADAEEKTAGEMSDGLQGGGSALDFVTGLLGDRITTSVVGLGVEADRDVDFLKQLAERGNGRFYLTNDATTLPQIFSTETMKVAQSSLVEEPFQPTPVGRSPMLEGIDWKESPLLLGYNTTKPKPTAEVLLATERGEPLLATWRYGLGQSAAFTSDAKGRWASEWLGWPGFGKFWSQVVRGLMRRSEESQFQVTTAEASGRLQIRIDAVTPDGKFRNGAAVTVTAALSEPSGRSEPDGHSEREGRLTETKRAVQDGPGSYNVGFDLPETGSTVFSVHSPDLTGGDYVFGYTRSYPKEFVHTGTDEAFLSRLAETAAPGRPGRIGSAAAPERVFDHPPAATGHWRDLTNYFLEAALLLFPVDIWLRRRNWVGDK